MEKAVVIVNELSALFTLAGIIFSVALLVSFIVPTLRNTVFTRFVEKKSLFIAFLVSLVATLGSLFYSDVVGYEPCKLCWFQRIFMYPQVLLFGIAAYKNDVHMKLYGIVLSAFGAAIALFHYIGQFGWNPFGLECLAIGYSASCSKNFVIEYGFVTIPLMSLMIFVIILLSLCTKTSQPSSQ